MKIGTWNVNSIRQRQAHVARWLSEHRPEILLLQEIKCEAAAFPTAAFADLGYRCEIVGQKSYNGVAVLARVPFATRAVALPGLPADDAQARYVEIAAERLVVAGIYLPNGNSGGDAGYHYKLRWMACLASHAEKLLAAEADLVIAGDFNVCPEPIDAAPGTLSPDDALRRPTSIAAWRRLVWLGLTDAVRALHPTGPAYSFWDYQAGAWPRDNGLRIDHALLSARPAERLVAAAADRAERGRDQPSDHVPLLIELAAG